MCCCTPTGAVFFVADLSRQMNINNLPIAMKTTILMIACAFAVTACSQNGEPRAARNWEMVPATLVGTRPVVAEYEVEFLPMLPDVPNAVVVGRFLIRNDAKLDLGDEAMVQAIKRRAASMGGNTIVYPHTGITEATVAYVPQEESVHGGDELAL